MEKKAWQCHLSERDWAIVFFAWDSALSLTEAVSKFAEFEQLANEMGHHGHCVQQPEACFKCIVLDAYEEGHEMAESWAKERPIREEDKYL